MRRTPPTVSADNLSLKYYHIYLDLSNKSKNRWKRDFLTNGFLIYIDTTILTNYLLPVEPNPPAPLTVSESSSASSKSTFKKGVTTSCAMRSP